MKLIHFYLIFIALLAQGCTGALKSKCKQTNWYKHGKNIAMSGKSIHSDFFAKQCEQKKVQVDYRSRDQGYEDGLSKFCSSELVYETGLKGGSLNIQHCKQNSKSELKKMYNQGIVAFCQPSNGYKQGYNGLQLNQICPKKLAGDFEMEHSRGRLIYLSEFIKRTEAEVKSLKRQVALDKRTLAPKENVFSVIDIVPVEDLNRAREISSSTDLATSILLNKRKKMKTEVLDLRDRISNNERIIAKKMSQLFQAKSEKKVLVSNQ